MCMRRCRVRSRDIWRQREGQRTCVEEEKGLIERARVSDIVVHMHVMHAADLRDVVLVA